MLMDVMLFLHSLGLGLCNAKSLNRYRMPCTNPSFLSSRHITDLIEQLATVKEIVVLIIFVQRRGLEDHNPRGW